MTSSSNSAANQAPEPPAPAPAPEGSGEGGLFTGRKRRATRTSVKIVNQLMKVVICTGGVGVVLVFALIMAFIVWMVLPLFYSAQLSPETAVTIARPAAAVPPKPLAMGIDEDLASFWILTDTGILATYRAAGGELVSSEDLSNKPITAVSNDHGKVAIGYADGTVRFGRIKFDYEYLDPKQLSGVNLPVPGATIVYKNGVGGMTGANQLRVVRTVADLSDFIALGAESTAPIIAVDYSFTEEQEFIAAMRADHTLVFDSISKQENTMTGEITREASSHPLVLPEAYQKEQPAALLLGLNGKLLFLAYADGRLIRYDTRDPEKAIVAEEVDLLPAGRVSISKIQLLAGNLTLIVTDSGGGVAGWFPAPYENGGGGKDNLHMVKAHELAPHAQPVMAIGASARDRQFVTVDAAGNLVVRQMTSGTTQGAAQLALAAPPSLIEMAPKSNAVAVLDQNLGLTLIRLDNPHADGSLAAMFMPLWYEGYPKPDYVYQSSAGTDDAEPKFSLIPLIFGTLKATFYALVFSVPIAILGAIYTSEFMHPRTRNVIKPVIEMMASLPSVVLGFVAAMVLAPLVGKNIVAVLLAVGMVPMGLVGFGFIWQFLPGHWTRRVPNLVRFGAMFFLVIALLWISHLLGPSVEDLLFYGNIQQWLAGKVGTATPGWMVLLTPILFVALTLLFNLRIKPTLNVYQTHHSALSLLGFEVARVLIIMGLAFGIALALGAGLSSAGWDLRGTLVGPYNQRNSLILGMIMGFAIIPIIYTVSEDALSSVPNTLRSASLGMGATQWQTAIRVVLPVAFSGVFSACMIGFGRAAGETMIVLMASGRTPIMDLSLFDGLSALSANIATELPEAPANSTHYRILFMSALVLFVITFIVNTAAEIVRIRFRKQSVHL